MSVFSLVADSLLSSVEAQLSGTIGGRPAKLRACFVPGSLAWDDCECGSLTVELSSVGFSRQFPTVQSTMTDMCAVPYVVGTYNVTMLRCVPGPDKAGSSPSCAALGTSAVILTEDIGAMFTGVSSALASLIEDNTIIESAIGPILSQGPAGGCVGISQTVYAGFRNTWTAC